MKKLAVVFFIVFLFSGCSRAPWVIKSDPLVQKIDNKLYTIDFTPSDADSYGYRAFSLTIENKTDKDIELNWDRTFYLQGGQTKGGFLFEGIFLRDMNAPKPPDILFPKKTFSKTIFPNALATFNKYWRHDPLPNGENGIYLSLIIENAELREKLTVNVFTGYDESQRYQTGLGKLLDKK